jgi:hypothetical protein
MFTSNYKNWIKKNELKMTFYVEIIQQAGDWEGLCLNLIPYAFIFYVLYCSWKIASTYPLEFLSNWSIVFRPQTYALDNCPVYTQILSVQVIKPKCTLFSFKTNDSLVSLVL